jgi:hypothetical protein
LTVSSLGFDSNPGDQYFVPIYGQLALYHKAWWTPLADGKMVLHVLMGSVCLSVDVYMVDIGGIAWVIECNSHPRNFNLQKKLIDYFKCIEHKW